MTLPPMACRACRAPVERVFVDLGDMPLSNAYPSSPADFATEQRYPLRARVCDSCFLVQLDHNVSPEVLFADYAYFSSYSDTWLEHARRFAEGAIQSYALTAQSLVVEIASNDGYLLRNFVAAGVPVLGVEPAANVAEVACAAGVPTVVEFFGTKSATGLVADGKSADLVVANNVFAHVPDTRDFAEGLATLVRPGGVVSLEFPHLLRLIREVQFDTIYHEHFCYLSLLAVENVLGLVGLRVFDVEELATHGGSLRVLAERVDSPRPRPASAGVDKVRGDEAAAGLRTPQAYERFSARVETCCASLNRFLDDARTHGSAVVAYGAAAKGNTLLNAAGVTTDEIAFVVDRSPHKQGRFLPGTHLPIRAPEAVADVRPAYLLVLPWNLLDEITSQMAHIRDWGGRFVTPLPEVRVLG